MGQLASLDEDLLRRLPLPLAQLLRRAHNSKTAAERHHTAYYVWEAAIKLLGSVSIVEYLALPEHDEELNRRLEALARPSLGHWWEFTRRLLPVLADAGDESFSKLRDGLLKRSRDDMPRCAGLDAELLSHLDGKESVRSTVRLSELIDRIVRYRNTEIGHGAVGQRTNDFYGEMGNALFASAVELLMRFDFLAGRKLVFVEDVRRHASGDWALERFDLCSENPGRMPILMVPVEKSQELPRPGRTYLPPTLNDVGGACLHPLFLFEPESSLCYFLNARRGRGKAEYLCYTTGDVVQRDSLAGEQRELLAGMLGVDVADADSDDGQPQAQDESGSRGGEKPLQQVGEFELLSLLGQGSMGAVFRAWQPSLGRQVALKMLLRSGDARAEARFAREIRALGSVDHPNLVKVFTSGAQGDKWFYTMELIDGADLETITRQLGANNVRALTQMEWTQAIDTASEKARKMEQPLADEETRRKFLSPNSSSTENPVPKKVLGARSYVERVVETMRQVASAAHALHQVGVIHRDIKPANIMLTNSSERAVLMDLGLAQIADETEGRLTRTMQFVGTLRYACPEQILSVKLDARADVYSLGVTLWELLTLQPIFGATESIKLTDLMLKIQTQPPTRPRKINPAVPMDLDAIVMKCLAKDRNTRYATAHDLVEDLKNWQQGKTVSAQPKSLTYAFTKFLKNHRGTISPTTAVLLILLAVASTLGLFAEIHRRKIMDERETVLAEAAEARAASEQATKEKQLALVAQQAAEKNFAAAQARQQAAEQQTRAAIARRLAGESEALGSRSPERRLLLALEAINTTSSADEPPLAAAENSLRDALAHIGGVPLFLPASNDQQGLTAIEVSTDGRWLAASRRDDSILLCDLNQTDRDAALRALDGHEDFITCLAISPDGHWLISGSADSTARVWDLTATNPAETVRVLRGHDLAVTCLAIAPDNRTLITGGSDATARIWDLSADSPASRPKILRGHSSQIHCLSITSDGKQLLTGSRDQSVRVWDLTAEDPTQSAKVLKGHQGEVTCLGISPDQHWACTGSLDTTARLWDLTAADVEGSSKVLKGHTAEITALAISPKSQWLITGSADETAQLWNLQSSDPTKSAKVLKGHSGKINCVAFLPDGQKVVTGSADKTTRVWNLEDKDPAQTPEVFSGQSGSVTCLEVCPQGRWLVTGSHEEIWENTARVWDLSPQHVTSSSRILEETPGEVSSVAMSADGHWLCGSSGVNTVWLWDLQTKSPGLNGHTLQSSDGFLTSLGISPDGKWLVTGNSDRTVRIWDLAAADPAASMKVLQGHEESVLCLAITGDSRWLVTGSKDNTARIWDLSAADPAADARVLRGHDDAIWCVAISPDGRWVGTGSQDQTARIWDMSARYPARTSRILSGHEDSVSCLAFSPDGRWLCTGSNDFTARIWDLQAENPSGGSRVLRGHQQQIACLAISPDGHWLATGSLDKTARTWDLTQSDPSDGARSLIGHEGPVRCLAMTPDSRTVITGSDDTTLRLWDLLAADPIWDVRILRGHQQKVSCLTLLAKEQAVVTGSSDRSVRKWPLELTELIREAHAHLGRTLSTSERTAYAISPVGTTTSATQNATARPALGLELIHHRIHTDP